MNKTEAAHYLAAMIDGEGTVGHTGTCRHVSVANTDEDLIAATTRACDVLGITYRVVPHKKTREHYKQRWDVVISNQESMQIVLDRVPLQSARKVERLQKVLASYRTPRPDPALLRDLYVEKGKGTVVIGQELGFGPSSIRYWLRQDGVPLRTQSESAKRRWAAGMGRGKHAKAS